MQLQFRIWTMKLLLRKNVAGQWTANLRSGLARMLLHDDAFSFKKHPQIYFTHCPIDACRGPMFTTLLTPKDDDDFCRSGSIRSLYCADR